MDRTFTNVSCTSRMGFMPELGYLIRRPGLLHRRILVSEVRLNDPVFVSLTLGLYRIRANYLHRSSVDLLQRILIAHVAKIIKGIHWRWSEGGGGFTKEFFRVLI